MRVALCRSLQVLVAVVAVMLAVPAQAQTCDPGGCTPAIQTSCTDGGFRLTFVSYEPSPISMSGGGTYTYSLCNPPAGTCDANSGPRTGSSCTGHDSCTGNPNSPNYTPNGQCVRDCAIASQGGLGLSHMDVDFPALESCLTDDTTITGTCACTGGCTVGAFTLGDGSCRDEIPEFGDGTVAKCDSVSDFGPGACVLMSVTVSGETNVVGLGTVAVIDKDGNQCLTSCLGGPVCRPHEVCDNNGDDDCDGLIDCDDPDCDNDPACGDDGGDCLTRTLGFWGTHPWITNNYAPVTVCGHTVGCDGAAGGGSNPSCEYGHCNDIMEALGSNSSELKNVSSYIALIKQLAAAKLNLAATTALTEAGRCSGFSYGGKTIQAWIETCEATNLCSGSQSKISASGCIEALNAFNNSQDILASTPSPFDRPPVDDDGNVNGADSSGFTSAGHSGIVVGKQSCQNQ